MCQGLAGMLERARQGRRRSGKVGSLSVESETPRWRTVAPRPTLPARPLFPSVAPPTQAPLRQGAGSVGPHSLSLKSRVLPTPHSPRAQPEWGRGGDTRAKTQGGGELEGRGRPARHCPSRGQGQLPGRQAAPASGSVPSARCPHMSPCHHRVLQTKTPRPSRRRWPGRDHTGWMRGQFFLAGRQQRGASCQACLRLGCGHTPHMPEAPIRFRSLNTHMHAGASVTCLLYPFLFQTLLPIFLVGCVSVRLRLEAPCETKPHAWNVIVGRDASPAAEGWLGVPAMAQCGLWPGLGLSGAQWLRFHI